jgi:parallel beta-helix repeat protein
VLVLVLLAACAPGVWPASVSVPAADWVCGAEPLLPAYQPTYYVATDGSDRADGRSPETAFRTLQRAVGVLEPGDVVWLRGGVYGSDVELRRSGTAGRPIVIESYPGECAVFDGSGLDRTQRVRLVGVRHVVLRNLVLRRSPSEGIFLRGSHDVVVTHVRVHDNRGSGILSMEGDRNLFSYVIAHDNVDTPSGEHADGISISSGDRNRIESCLAFRNSDDGIDTWKSTGTVIERCVAFGNGRLDGDGNGFKLGGADGEVGTVVRHSVAFDNRVDGFDYNTGRGILLEHNPAFGNGRFGFVASDATLRNNLSVGNGRGDSADGVRRNVVGVNSWELGLGPEVFVSVRPVSGDFLRLRPDGAAADGGELEDGRPTHLGALPVGETLSSMLRHPLRGVVAAGTPPGP